VANILNGVYVFDFDDVLVDLSRLMYSNIRENWRVYKKYFWNPGELTTEQIHDREFFFMNEWLIQKKFIELTSEEYAALSIKIRSLFTSTMFNQPDIYGNSVPMEFAKKTLQNPLFLDSPNVSQVVILTRNVSDAQAESKERFIKKYFNHPKIKIITVRRGESKGQALLENNINFNVFVDDELPNIREVAELFRDNLNEKEFIIPKYGYNKNFPKELRFLIEENGGRITYFDPFKKS